MRENNHHIDQHIRNRFEGFEITPPEEVWTAIEAELHEDDKDRAFFWYLLPVIGVLLLNASVLLGITYFHLPDTYSGPENNLSDLSWPMTPLKSGIHHHSNLERRMLNVSAYVHINNIGLVNHDYQQEIPTASQIRNNSSGTYFQPSREELDAVNAKHIITTGSISNPPAQNSIFSKQSIGSKLFNGENSTSQTQQPGAFPRKLSLLPLNPFCIDNSLPLLERQIPNGRKRHSFLDRLAFDVYGGISSFRIQAKDGTQELKDLVAARSKNALGYQVSAIVNVHITPSISAYTGVQYDHLENDITYETYTDGTYIKIDTVQMIDTIAITVETEVDTVYVTSKSARNRHTLVSIPVGFSYQKMLGRKSSLELRIGGEISIHQKNTGFSILSESGVSENNASSFKKYGTFSLTGSVRYLYEVIPKHFIFIQPSLGMGLNSITKKTILGRRQLFRYGAFIGYRYHL